MTAAPHATTTDHSGGGGGNKGSSPSLGAANAPLSTNRHFCQGGGKTQHKPRLQWRFCCEETSPHTEEARYLLTAGVKRPGVGTPPDTERPLSQSTHSELGARYAKSPDVVPRSPDIVWRAPSVPRRDPSVSRLRRELFRDLSNTFGFFALHTGRSRLFHNFKQRSAFQQDSKNCTAGTKRGN